MMTNEKMREKSSAPISAFGDIEATAYRALVNDLGLETALRDTHLTDRRVVCRVDDTEHEECVPCTRGREADCPVPCKEEEDCAEDIPGDFHSDLSSDERGPAVHSTRAFPNLVDVADVDIWDHELAGGWNTEDRDHKKCLVGRV